MSMFLSEINKRCKQGSPESLDKFIYLICLQEARSAIANQIAPGII